MSHGELSPDVAAFWSEFLRATGRPDDTPLLDVFHFDDNERDADLLASLVLAGTKRATASLAFEYEREGTPIPTAGDLSVVTDFAGHPLCVIETTQVDVVAFEDVDDDFAAAEGEGDGSLRHWRQAHEAYFGRVCQNLGIEMSGRMDVVCERFEVVSPTT
ncbi:MAG: ASCH domain-containing protein [Actinomycetota bacterium]